MGGAVPAGLVETVQICVRACLACPDVAPGRVRALCVSSLFGGSGIAVDHCSAGNIGGIHDLQAREWSAEMIEASDSRYRRPTVAAYRHGLSKRTAAHTATETRQYIRKG